MVGSGFSRQSLSKIVNMNEFSGRGKNPRLKKNDEGCLVFSSDEISYLMKKYEATVGVIILHNPKWGDVPVSQYDGSFDDMRKIIDHYAAYRPTLPFPSHKGKLEDLSPSESMKIICMGIFLLMLGLGTGILIGYII